MNRRELTKIIEDENQLPHRIAKSVVDGVFKRITANLASGHSVQILGFGTWNVKQRAARKGRNPYTGESIKIKAKRVVSFKAGVPLKKAILSGKLAEATRKRKVATKKAAPVKAKKGRGRGKK